MKYVTAIALFVAFSIAAVAAPLFALAGLPFAASYAGNIVHSMDMVLAAILGWNGRRTVSAECGRELIYEPRPCCFCRVMCAILDYKLFGRYPVLEPGHCRKEGAK